MLDEKRIAEIRRRVQTYLAEGIITTKEKAEFTDFFLEHSRNFLDSARAEHLLSTDETARKQLDS